MELVDIYDKDRNKTGKVKDRFKDELEVGEFALVVGTLLINSKKQLLISKRSMKKTSYPGYWEFIGGASITGENSEDAIIREVEEEIGIKLKIEDGIFVKSIKTDHLHKDLWAFKLDIDLNELHLDENEVERVKWENIDNVIKLRENGEMIESCMVTKEEYETSLKKLNIK